MTIPTYDQLMLPLLKLLADGLEWSFGDVVDRLATDNNLTEEELARLLPSGRYPLFRNRVGWASTYLSKALLLNRPRRGYMVITERGHQLLGAHPDRIDTSTLKQYREWREFQGQTSKPHPVEEVRAPVVAQTTQTPDEVIGEGFRQYEASLIDDLLRKLRETSPSFFEKLVVQLLVVMGYGGTFDDATKVVGKTDDGGIDGVIKEDRLGLDAIHVQAKRWQNPVGRPVVAEFVGNLVPHQSRKGVLITTSTFTRDAEQFVMTLGQRVVLTDGKQLAELMVEHGVGVIPMRTYVLKRIDNDYFDEES